MEKLLGAVLIKPKAMYLAVSITFLDKAVDQNQL